MAELLKNKTILIVDDDPDTLDLLRHVLEAAGASVVTASPEAAFGTYRESPPHAVITDMRLGSSDGYAVLRTIRETDLEYRGSTPVVALTGFASPEDETRAFAAGFDAYIAKPFDPDEVVKTLCDLVSHARDSAA
jgi:CheY-like chemotaxis protein